MSNKLLEINSLIVSFKRFSKETKVVQKISLSVKAGEKVALVGESGSGKSVTAPF